MSKHTEKTRKLVYCAAFIAIAVVLGVFLFIPLSPSSRLSLAPLAVMFAGSALGPLWGAAVGASTDLISFLIRPTGNYFPGFTLTMALYGLLAGLMLYNKPFSILKISLKTLVIQLVCSLFLNTVWNYLLLGTPFIAILLGRLPAFFIAYGVYAALLCVLLKNKDRIVRSV